MNDNAGKKPSIVAYVAVAEAPTTACTLAEWVLWRISQDVRMAAQIEAQVAAASELQAGATRH